MRNTNNIGHMGSLSAEMGADFGDKRLTRRLKGMVETISSKPSESFPKALGSEAATEAGYRLLRNPKVKPQKILEPHFLATAKRVSKEKEVLVIHDTSFFHFNGEVQREGLGWHYYRHSYSSLGQGFFGHFALALDSESTPLGVIGLETFTRQGKPRQNRGKTTARRDPNRESQRWHRLVDQVERRLDGLSHCIHVMDREGDSYELFCSLVQNDQSFIIRARHDRALEGSNQTLATIANQTSPVHEREVPLSSRKQSSFQSNGTNYPARRMRQAKLRFKSQFVCLRRPVQCSTDLPETLQLNVVQVYEVRAPKGESPVNWMLLTTEPVQTKAQILKVVDIYRARWKIEEYFKALKTGCAMEKRQLESISTLLNALAVLAPVAWKLLLLRDLARSSPKASAKTVLSANQVKILKAVSKNKLSKSPNAKEVMMTLAAMGGHLKSNGEPGWQTIGKGYRDLLLMEVAWNAATDQQPTRCDQS